MMVHGRMEIIVGAFFSLSLLPCGTDEDEVIYLRVFFVSNVLNVMSYVYLKD